ncbi:MAG: hypothetical protein U0556_13535 [Dehalococcoidia bacterium]
MTRPLRIGHLFPEAMNLYGDRGNVLALIQRARWRAIEVEVVPIGLGEVFDASAVDLIFSGGDQDREQRRVATDLAGRKGEAIRQAIEDGMPALAVCGSYQLFGAGIVRPAGRDPRRRHLRSGDRASRRFGRALRRQHRHRLAGLSPGRL